jgi:hypothetical protein
MYFDQAVSIAAVFPPFNLATEPFAFAEIHNKIHKHDVKEKTTKYYTEI